MRNYSTINLYLASDADTMQLGTLLAPLLHPGAVIYLQGELGAGKTTLTRAMLRALGVVGPIKSPTYALVEIYQAASLHCAHFDFYRFNAAQELQDAGFRDYFNDQTICWVEWPERAMEWLPEAQLTIKLAIAGDGRQAEIKFAANLEQTCTTALDSIRDFSGSHRTKL